jgi:hypothetical protein
MTEQEKKDLVERFDKEVKNEIPKLRRDTPMARIRDFSNTMKNIEQLVSGSFLSLDSYLTSCRCMA